VATSLRQTRRTETIYARIRSGILDGTLRPGKRLKFPDVCAEFDASVAVIREALIRLAGEGLVSAEAHQGFAVTAISPDHLAELTYARLQIEGMVLRQSIRDGDLQWESALLAAYHTLQGTSRTNDGRLSDAWTTAHAEFHKALLSGCPNLRLRSIAEGLRSEAELYRQWSVTLGDEPGRNIDAEHKMLLTGAIARDDVGTVNALQEHIKHTSRLLMASAGDHAPF
jgi:DNA-binding GntR family transcriptional regulator